MDLWEQLLREIEQAGAAVRLLHVPSHVGIVGNTHADTLADMGRRKSPLLRGYVTSARRPQQEGQAQEQDESQTWMSHPCFLLKSGRPTRPLEAPPPPPTPRRQGVTPLLEVEDCTPASKRPCYSPDCTDRGRSPAHSGRHPCVTSGRNSSPHLPPPRPPRTVVMRPGWRPGHQRRPPRSRAARRAHGVGRRTPAALCLAHHNAHDPHSPLGSDPIDDRNPITVKRHRRPNSESGSLQSSSAGVRYPGAGALGIPARTLLWASLQPPPPSAACATTGTGG